MIEALRILRRLSLFFSPNPAKKLKTNSSGKRRRTRTSLFVSPPYQTLSSSTTSSRSESALSMLTAQSLSDITTISSGKYLIKSVSTKDYTSEKLYWKIISLKMDEKHNYSYDFRSVFFKSTHCLTIGKPNMYWHNSNKIKINHNMQSKLTRKM